MNGINFKLISRIVLKFYKTKDLNRISINPENYSIPFEY